MGRCCSAPIRPSDEEANMSAAIEEKMMADLAQQEKVVKILLLGSGDSGKTTLVKQLKLLHSGGLEKAELGRELQVVRMNTVFCMQQLIRACRALEIPLDSPAAREHASIVADHPLPVSTSAVPTSPIPLTLADSIRELWLDGGIQGAYRRRSEFSLLDSASYFLRPETLQRTFVQGYWPTVDDALRTRLTTTGMQPYDFPVESTIFRITDVGGQRGERKKWIHCFDDVNAILFVASLAEYDQVAQDDRTKNKLNESLELFKGIINLPWFRKAAVVLFLNKNDLFVEKITSLDLGVYFPQYAGGANYQSALDFIRSQYFDRVEDPAKNVYCHVTDATSQPNIEFVWTSTRQMILDQNMEVASSVLT